LGGTMTDPIQDWIDGGLSPEQLELIEEKYTERKKLELKLLKVGVCELMLYYQWGWFIDHCKKLFAKIWVGDAHILEAVLYIFATYKLENPDEPIHLHVTGPTQIGKSDSVKSALKFISEAYRLTRTFSKQWIFHGTKDGTLHQDMIIFSDDTTWEKEMAANMRNVLTSWDTGVERESMDGTKTEHLSVPKHINLVLTTVDQIVEVSEDGQDESRFLTLPITTDAVKERTIRDFMQAEKPSIDLELWMVHTFMEQMPRRKVTLHRSFTDTGPETRREFKRYLTLLKCHALLCNRETTNEEDVVAINTFLTYTRPMVNSTTPGLDDKHRAVLDCLPTITGKPPDKYGLLSILDIMRETKLTDGKVRRVLHGKGGTIENPVGGLLMSHAVRKMFDKEDHTWYFYK
jgi:hypothetical protein